MRRRVNDGFWPVSHVTSSEDTRRACRQCHWIDEQAAPGRDAHTGAFWQERGVRCLAYGNEYRIDRQVEVGTVNRDWFATTLFIRFAQVHPLANDALDGGFLGPQYQPGSDQLVQLDAFGQCCTYLVYLGWHFHTCAPIENMNSAGPGTQC